MANSNLNDLFPLEHPLYSANMSTPSNSEVQYASYRGGTLTRMMNLYRGQRYANFFSRQNLYSDSYDDKLSGLEEGISTLRTVFRNIQGHLMDINEKMKNSTFCSKDSNGGTPNIPSPAPQNECEVRDPECSEYIYLTFIIPLLLFFLVLGLFFHHRNTWSKLFRDKNLVVTPKPLASTSPAIEDSERDSNQRSRTPSPPLTWYAYFKNQLSALDLSLVTTVTNDPMPTSVCYQYLDQAESSSTGSSSNPSYREYIISSQDAPQQYEMTFSSLPPVPPMRTTSLGRTSVITPGNAETSV